MKNIDETIEVSPLEFLQGIFHNVPDKGNVSVLGFRADPKIQKYWKPHTAMKKIPLCIKGENNTYFNISTLLYDKDNKLKASKNNVAATHVILVDDLGTGSGAKGKIDGLKLTPSYLGETSLDNYQAGYILKNHINKL